MTASLGVKKLVLDPGHGGNDSGAAGPDACGRRRSRSTSPGSSGPSSERANYDVAMTRDADTFVSLRQRAQFANQSSGRTCSCRST